MNTIGKKLRQLRIERGMTLKEVSEKTGLSISFISQVETNKSSITIESLMKIAEVFHVTPSYFFEREQQVTLKKNIAVHKQATAEKTKNIAFNYNDLSGDFPNRSLAPSLIHLEPRKESATPMPHNGEEFIYMLDGVLTIVFDEESIDVHPGESIHMKSSIPHNWMNFTDRMVIFIHVSG
uniref:helix-turn-helix domain-containing protein n=1 Tax=uncultured Allobacillus sp. TaxID=1638025 RepID=UPI00259AB1A5|nr:XRE family transcriptional regulator [uncultured Allobacillus sp.]